jgi:hypothetical protein
MVRKILCTEYVIVKAVGKPGYLVAS